MVRGKTRYVIWFTSIYCIQDFFVRFALFICWCSKFDFAMQPGSFYDAFSWTAYCRTRRILLFWFGAAFLQTTIRVWNCAYVHFLFKDTWLTRGYDSVTHGTFYSDLRHIKWWVSWVLNIARQLGSGSHPATAAKKGELPGSGAGRIFLIWRQNILLLISHFSGARLIFVSSL